MGILIKYGCDGGEELKTLDCEGTSVNREATQKSDNPKE